MEIGKGWKKWLMDFEFIEKALEQLETTGVKQFHIVYTPENKPYNYCIFYYNEN